ncbi:MAG: hypothetical protein ACFHWX_13990 [Bacteroidota bacterium]
MKHLLVVVSILMINVSRAQTDVSNLDLDGNVTKWFDSTIGIINLPIISGSYYQVLHKSTNSHQFFISSKWNEIEISYSNQPYYDFYGLYDIETDVLLLRHTGISYNAQPLDVRQEKIDWFNMEGHYFKYYQESEAPINRSGFYDELYIGKHIELIVKREKKAFPSQGELTMEFKNYDRYFLKYQGIYNQVSSRRSVIKVLLEYKKELRKYIRQNMLKPKKEHDQDLVMLLEYCNNLVTE